MSGSRIKGTAVRRRRTEIRGRGKETRGRGAGPGAVDGRSARVSGSRIRDSAAADEDSNSDVKPDVVGSEEEGEEEEEDESDDSASGVETIRVENVTVRHKLYTIAASWFCSACRVCDYDKCTMFPMYPALVRPRRLNVVEAKVVMDIGVDPAGLKARAGGRRRKKTGHKVFQQEQLAPV